MADVRTLFADAQHPYMLGLLASVPRLDQDRKRLSTIKGMVPAPDQMPAGCRFAPRCAIADERCRSEEPPLRALKPGHVVACWKAPIEEAVS